MLKANFKKLFLGYKSIDRCFLGMICLVTFVYYVVFIYTKYVTGHFFNADYEFYTVCGRDIFQGNVFLHDWLGSTNSFYFLSIIYGLCGCIFGYNVYLMAIVSALLYTFMAGLVCYIVLKRNQTAGAIRYVKTIFALLIMLSSCYSRYVHGIFAGSHFDGAIISLLLFYMITNYYEKETVNKFAFMIIYVLLFLEYLSDSLTIIFTAIPIFLVVVINLFMNKISKRKIQILIFNMIVIAGEIFLSRIVINSWNGILIPYEVNSISIVSYSDLFTRIAFCIEVLFFLFSGDCFGAKISAASIDCLFMAFIVVIFVGLLFMQRRHWIKSIFNQFCFSVVLVSVLVLCLTDYALFSQGAAYTARLLPLCFFCCIILFFCGVDFKWAIDKYNLKIKYCVGGGIFLAAWFCFFSVKNISFENRIDTNNKYKRIADVLLEEGLSNGFATYLNSFPIIMESGYSVNITSITGPETSFFAWLNKKPSKEMYANFIVFDDSNWENVNSDSIKNDIGIPDHVIDIDDAHIYIWNKNIMPLINQMHYATD